MLQHALGRAELEITVPAAGHSRYNIAVKCRTWLWLVTDVGLRCRKVLQNVRHLQ